MLTADELSLSVAYYIVDGIQWEFLEIRVLAPGCTHLQKIV